MKLRNLIFSAATEAAERLVTKMGLTMTADGDYLLLEAGRSSNGKVRVYATASYVGADHPTAFIVTLNAAKTVASGGGAWASDNHSRSSYMARMSFYDLPAAVPLSMAVHAPTSGTWTDGDWTTGFALDANGEYSHASVASAHGQVAFDGSLGATEQGTSYNVDSVVAATASGVPGCTITLTNPVASINSRVLVTPQFVVESGPTLRPTVAVGYMLTTSTLHVALYTMAAGTYTAVNMYTGSGLLGGGFSFAVFGG